MTRCQVTELLVGQCAHCVAPSKPTPRDPFSAPARKPSRWFRSMYAGRCSVCEDPFGVGDRIRSDDEGGYLAEQCCGDEA